MNSNDIINTISQYKNKVNSEMMAQHYNSIINAGNYNIANKNVNNNLQYAKNIVDNYILYAEQKYGYSDIHIYLSDYLRGNESAITRDNNYRDLFSEYLEPSIVLSITGPNIDSYIQNVASYYMNQEENQRTNYI